MVTMGDRDCQSLLLFDETEKDGRAHRFGSGKRKWKGHTHVLPRRRFAYLLLSLTALAVGAALLVFRQSGAAAERWRPLAPLQQQQQQQQTLPSLLPSIKLDNSLPAYHATELGCDERLVQTWNDTLFIFKTGATVAHQRAPVHLQSALRCMPNKLFISDVDMDVDGVHFNDVIKYLHKKIRADPQLSFYRDLLRQSKATNGTLFKAPANNPKAGWWTDRFKFIPQVWLAWKHRTESTKWFVFIEADTLIDWTNLRIMLDGLDVEQPLYVGYPQWTAKFMYAHGGSGFLLSHAAMKRSVGVGPQEWLRRWGHRALTDEFGDRLLGRALSAYGVKFSSASPLLQWNRPQLAAILPNLWCKPVVSMHHITPEQVKLYWRTVANKLDDAQHQQQQQPPPPPRNTSLLWRDVFDAFIMPTLRPIAVDWDNQSHEYECSAKYKCKTIVGKASMVSAGGCARQCRKVADCLQWSFHDGTCRMGRAVHVGKPVRSDMLSQKWVSGWIMERIRDYQREHTCDTGADWSIDA